MPHALDLGLLQFWCDRSHDPRRDLILQIEYIVDRAVKTLGPQVGPRLCIDELSHDAHTVFRLAHAPFQYITRAQFATNLSNVCGPALVGEARRASVYKQHPYERQGRDDLIHHAISEICLLRIS